MASAVAAVVTVAPAGCADATVALIEVTATSTGARLPRTCGVPLVAVTATLAELLPDATGVGTAGAGEAVCAVPVLDKVGAGDATTTGTAGGAGASATCTAGSAGAAATRTAGGAGAAATGTAGGAGAAIGSATDPAARAITTGCWTVVGAVGVEGDDTAVVPETDVLVGGTVAGATTGRTGAGVAPPVGAASGAALGLDDSLPCVPRESSFVAGVETPTAG